MSRKQPFEPIEGYLNLWWRLTNNPATFQTMMNDIFRHLIMKGAVYVYLDVILIFFQGLAEHWTIVHWVLQRLHKHQQYLRPEKCEFKCTKIEYLGLIISEGKAEMDPVKVHGVTEWPKPQNQKEVQAFLGFANFYYVIN